MDFDAVRQRVFEKTPVFKRVIEEYGSLSLEAYFERLICATKQVRSSRSQELVEVFRDHLTALLGPQIAQSVSEEFSERYAVSTADHHGLLAHPFFFSCHIAQSFALQKQKYRSIFVWSCGGISLNNSSFPRGILVHDAAKTLVRLPLFSLKHRHETVYGFEPYSFPTVAHMRDLARACRVSRTVQERLQQNIADVFEEDETMRLPSFADQITRTNYALWRRLPGQEEMHFVMVQQEDIAREVLLRYHLGQGTILDRMLTDPEVIRCFENAFEGVPGACSVKEQKGTTLFWARVKGERLALWRRGNELVSAHESYRIECHPERIRDALMRKELIPSMALTFIILSFYYGVTCGGGFFQVNYLSAMKEAYRIFLHNIDESSLDSPFLEKIETSRLAAEMAPVLLVMKNDPVPVQATGWDMLVYSDELTENRLREMVKSCTVSAATDQMMPEIDRVLGHASQSVELPPFPYQISLYG